MTLPFHTNIVYHDDLLLFNSTVFAIIKLSPTPVLGLVSKVPTNKSNN